MHKSLNTSMQSFENTKVSIVGSNLGKALGMSTSNNWATVVDKLKGVSNRGSYSKWFTPSTTNQSVSLAAGYYSGGTIGCYGAALTSSFTQIAPAIEVPTTSASDNKTYIFTLAGNTGSKYVVFTVGTHGNTSNGETQLAHTLTATNATVTLLKSVSSANIHVRLWSVEKSNTASASTVTIQITRTSAQITVFPFAVPAIISKNEITGSNTVAGAFGGAYGSSLTIGAGRSFFLLTISTHGNTTMGTLIHYLMNTGMRAELYAQEGTNAIVCAIWHITKSNSSDNSPIYFIGNRANASVSAYVIRLE